MIYSGCNGIFVSRNALASEHPVKQVKSIYVTDHAAVFRSNGQLAQLQGALRSGHPAAMRMLS